jgi:hypothetical protein
MSRPKTATAVLEARGAFAKHPERKRENEPDTGRGIGPAPVHFTSEQGQAWDEIVSICAPGVFQSSDRLVVEAIAVELTIFRANPKRYGTSALALLTNLLGRCGMTPSDRSKVVVRGEDAKPEKAVRSLDSFRR